MRSEEIERQKKGSLGRYHLIVCLLAVFVLMPFLVQAEEYRQQTKAGQINWYSGQILAESEIMAPNQKAASIWQEQILVRQAEIEARKKLAATLKEVRIDKGLTVKEILSRDQELAARVQGEIHNSLLEIVEKGKNRVRVRAGLSFRGRLSDSLIPRSIWFEETASEPASFETNSSRTSPYTGLVIDAQSLEFEPALIIRILDELDREIYGPSLVEPNVAVSQGICQYVTDLQSAVAASRVGDHPFLVRAGGMRQEANALWISEQTAAEFMAASDLRQIYQECRVVIVLGNQSRSEFREYLLD
ncbi:MAG: hypothetical protein K9K79_10530 [Desulfohalobiaceae bacterium]|nr:hypothetical protein [Desulfohalobiaceae bacterium]